MSYIDLRDKKERGQYWKFRKAIENQTGYSYKDVLEDEPLLIPEDEFEDYAQELAKDLGLMTKSYQWPCNHINWEDAANELKNDYTEVIIDNITYLFRSF